MRIRNNQRIAQLEKKYGIRVYDDSFYNPLTNRCIKSYKFCSADGCPWENGLSYKGLFEECHKWGKDLIEIKNKVEAYRF